jgi:hypothetical protein
MSENREEGPWSNPTFLANALRPTDLVRLRVVRGRPSRNFWQWRGATTACGRRRIESHLREVVRTSTTALLGTKLGSHTPILPSVSSLTLRTTDGALRVGQDRLAELHPLNTFELAQDAIEVPFEARFVAAWQPR